MIWRLFLLTWCFFILSQGPICGYVAVKMWRIRKSYPVGRYVGAVMGALCLTTGMATYMFARVLIIGGPRLVPGTTSVVYVRGLEIFSNLPIYTYVVLAAQALQSAALWAKGLYFLGVLNGKEKS